MTTTEAAQYLTERGYTVHSKKTGADSPPPSELVKRWCIKGKLKARKSGWVWLIEQESLDQLIRETIHKDIHKPQNPSKQLHTKGRSPERPDAE